VAGKNVIERGEVFISSGICFILVGLNESD